MKTLILNHSQIERLLPMAECIGVMEEAFIALARGEYAQPLRTVFRPDRIKGVMAMMPAYRFGGKALFGLKAIGVFPGNADIGKDAHPGAGTALNGYTG